MNKEKENAKVSALYPSPIVGSVYGFGWERMKKYFLDLFLIILIVGVVLAPLGMIESLDGRHTPGGVILRIFAFAYWLLFYAPIAYGSAFIFLKAAREEQFEIKDMFSAFENYLNVVLAHLLKSAIIGIGIFLLLVPGIIFACKLAFVEYLVLDRKMDPVEAVKESWRMTKGYEWQIFFMGLTAIAIAMGGLLCLVVGIIPAVIWIRSAFASMYYAVSKVAEEKS